LLFLAFNRSLAFGLNIEVHVEFLFNVCGLLRDFTTEQPSHQQKFRGAVFRGNLLDSRE